MNAEQLPDYAMHVQGLKHDGHDTGVASADRLLKATFASKLQDPKFMEGTLFVMTFDENKIYTLLLRPMAKPGAVIKDLHSHGSLLRTIEDIFALGNLGRNTRRPHKLSRGRAEV